MFIKSLLFFNLITLNRSVEQLMFRFPFVFLVDNCFKIEKNKG